MHLPIQGTKRRRRNPCLLLVKVIEMGRVTESQGICDFTDVSIFVRMTGYIGIVLNLGMKEAQLLHLLAIVEQKQEKWRRIRDEKCWLK